MGDNIRDIIINSTNNTQNDDRILSHEQFNNILTYFYPGYHDVQWNNFTLRENINLDDLQTIINNSIEGTYPDNLFIAMANVIRHILIMYNTYDDNGHRLIDDDTIVEGIEPLLQILDEPVRDFPDNDDNNFLFFLAWYNMLLTLIEDINGPEEIVQHPSLENYNRIMTRRQRREQLCCICQENFSEEGGVITECGHLYHQDCLQQLACYNNTGPTVSCPMCRTSLRRGARFGYYW